jgi:hypothetical protein
MEHEETGAVTGTKDKRSDLIWFVQACLENALRLQTYIDDAGRGGDQQLVELLRRAQAASRQGAEEGLAGRTAEPLRLGLG